MLQQDQQQRQKLVLTAEIRQLEKKYNELLHDVDRLDSSKKEEYRQFTTEIKGLTDRRNDLLEQVEKLRDTITTLTDAYTKSKEGMDSYVKTHLDTAHKEATTIIAGARNIETQAVGKHNEAILLQTENDNRKTALDTKSLVLESQATELQAATIALDTRREHDQKLHQHSEEALHEMQKTMRGLTGEIESLEKTKEAMLIEIGTTKQAIATELHVAEEKNKKADVLLATLEDREKIMTKREEFIRNETILLKDRQGQLDRAIIEFRAKGVKI